MVMAFRGSLRQRKPTSVCSCSPRKEQRPVTTTEVSAFQRITTRSLQNGHLAVLHICSEVKETKPHAVGSLAHLFEIQETQA